jgi:cold-inducible RNA-binding protein
MHSQLANSRQVNLQSNLSSNDDLKPGRREHLEKAGGLRQKSIMSTKLYLGNLTFDTTENDLRDMLAAHGPVNEINLVMDKMTGRPRGFAFATMNSEEGAKAAITALNGKDWKGRPLTVNEARPREDRGGGGGRGGYGGGSRERY